MKSQTRLVVTDLDNTLYDWVTYFSESFEAMLDMLVPMLEQPKAALAAEFKVIHQRYGDSETPFAALELPAAEKRFGAIPRAEMKSKLAPALDAFRDRRRKTLNLYAGVAETLYELNQRGVVLVAHTEASAINAWGRLSRLGVASCFQKLFALEMKHLPHPEVGYESPTAPPAGFVHLLPRSERKPNPELLLDICSQVGCRPSEAIYVGDSLTRDISMANDAGVPSAWAKYGTRFERSAWEKLVAITHWTDDDVRREGELRSRFAGVRPRFELEQFSDLLSLVPWSTVQV